MEALLSSTISPLTLLLDSTTGPVDASFLLYHHLTQSLSQGAPTALLVACHPASHHRAVLRKLLGPTRSGGVTLVCAWEVSKRCPDATPEALGAALLSALGVVGGLGGLCLCVEDVEGLCEVAGGVGNGLKVLESIIASRPATLLLRATPGCDWRVDAGGALAIAGSVCSRLEELAGVVVFAKDLPTGFSRDVHGRLEVWKRGGGGGGGVGGMVYKVLPEGGVKEASVLT